MKVKVLSILAALAALALFAACENPLVSNILPDRGGGPIPPVVPPGSFLVTFDRNGGNTNAVPAYKIVTPPATTVDTLPTPPQRTGYNFTGWNTLQNGSGSPFTAATVVTASITVYAQWTPVGVTPPVVVDFENDAIGKTYTALGGYSGGQEAFPTVKVVADPANAGQKSLEISSTDYNQAAVIPIALPAGKTLNDAESFSFRIRLTKGKIEYKRVLVYAAGSPGIFVHGGFGNEANSQYAQFAANKLGETDEIPELPSNQWFNYTIPISGLNNVINGLSGTIYLAIGIQHSDTEAITYLLDDLTFTFRATPIEPGAPAKVDFENDAVGKTYNTIGGSSTPTVAVVADPAGNSYSSQKSLQITSGSYNQAAVIPITLSGQLNSYNSFTFRFYLTSGTISDKDIAVYVASSTDTFIQYGFGNDAGGSNPEFAANLLGKARLDNASAASTQWKDYSITITNPGSAISNLSGNVYIAIGINQDQNITYLLDDLTFSAELPPDAPQLVTFEGDDTGKTYGSTEGNNKPTVAVAADPSPAAGSQKSLRVVTNGGSGGNSGYNQAAIIPISLPDALNTYRSFRFRYYHTGDNLLDDQNQPRKLNVYVADNTAAFVRYGFGNPSTNENQFANLFLGEVTPDYGETGHWVDYAVNFTSPGSAISSLTGNVYVAIGINHDTAVTYYLDDLTFSKDPLNKQPGAELVGTLTVSKTGGTADLSGVTVPTGSTQTVEYSVSLTSAGAPGVWQSGTHFTGLTALTSYTAYARSAQNALYNAGPEKTAMFTTDDKTAGASLTGSITTTQITHNRITINAIAAPSNGQTVEYAISEEATAPVSGWQDGTTFYGLTRNTDYYVFARAKENDDYKAGAEISASFKTTAGPPLNPVVPAIVVNFEDDALGATSKYKVTSAPNNGSGTVTIVADPAPTAQSQKSLNMRSTGYNIGAVIPINLPFTLENYQSFTFRFKLASGTPSNLDIVVYVADAENKFVQYGFGNPSNNANQFANLLLGSAAPDFAADQWIEYEIEINGAALNNAIKTLSGNIFLAIGINSSGTIELLFDDLTFNAVSTLSPDPTISPTTATFVTTAPADIPVTVNLYGKSLTGISKNGTSLISGTDYIESGITVYGSTVTLKPSCFAGVSAGTVTLTFEFSGGTSKTIAITISATSLVTLYNFADLADGATVPVEFGGSGDLTAVVTGGALKVTKTTNYSTPILILPFDLGTTKLADYALLEIVIKSASGDLGSKRFRIEVRPAATAFTAAGSNPTIYDSGGQNYTLSAGTKPITNAANNSSASPGNFDGKIKIGISFDNTNPYEYAIQSIRLTNP